MDKTTQQYWPATSSIRDSYRGKTEDKDLTALANPGSASTLSSIGLEGNVVVYSGATGGAILIKLGIDSKTWAVFTAEDIDECMTANTQPATHAASLEAAIQLAQDIVG